MAVANGIWKVIMKEQVHNNHTSENVHKTV